MTQLEKVVEAYDNLKAENEKLRGELAMRKREKYGKGGEKPKDDSSSSNDRTKDEDEENTSRTEARTMLWVNRFQYALSSGREMYRMFNEKMCMSKKSILNRLTFIETCNLQKKAALDFFQEFFKKITEGRADYELIAQEALG